MEKPFNYLFLIKETLSKKDEQIQKKLINLADATRRQDEQKQIKENPIDS